jgi:hypothetical protein
MVRLLARRRALRRGFAAAAVFVAFALPASAQLVFDSNILFQNTAGTCSGATGGLVPCGATYSDCNLVNTLFPHNRVVDPQLNPQLATVNDPRWDPQAASPALGRNGAPVTEVSALDPWFTDVCYAGAVPFANGNPANDWTTGWTWYGQNGCTPELEAARLAGRPVVMVMADIAANTNWTANNIYSLVGRIGVLSGVTLTIQPGTIVVGTGTTSFLVIERGGNIDAQGTRQSPIIFTSDALCGQQLPGDWGGVVIHGLALANCADVPPVQGGTGCRTTDGINSCVSEGGAGSFGGTDDDDNSGIMRYCRIEYSGVEIAPNNELNCLTMNGVGRNTTLEYLQTHRGSDDGFEWFGGTARCRFLVATSNSDDNLDWQMGYRGRVQFAVCRQNSEDGADKGIEADNNEFNNNCPLESNPMFANLTLVGVLNVSGVGTAGINLRRGTNGVVVNSIIVGFTGFGLDIDNAPTFENCAGAVPALYTCPTSALGPDQARQFVVSAGPNPTFGPSTLAFELESESHVTVRIYDAAGRLVQTVVDGPLGAGPHRLPWEPQNGAAGAYFYQVVAGTQKASGRLMVLN